jgi:hypothetical protein
VVVVVAFGFHACAAGATLDGAVATTLDCAVAPEADDDFDAAGDEWFVHPHVPTTLAISTATAGRPRQVRRPDGVTDSHCRTYMIVDMKRTPAMD